MHGFHPHLSSVLWLCRASFIFSPVLKSVTGVVGNKSWLVVAGNDANGEDAEVEGGDVSHGGLQVF